MLFEEYYKDYRKHKDYKKKFCSGNSKTVEDFYRDCISMTQLDSKLVEKWHNMLIEYINLPDAIFWIRKYEGGGSKGNWENRRACLTKYRYNGKDRYYVSVSNFDAQDIFNMISLGVEPPTASKLLELMKRFEYKFHYDEGKSSKENEYAAYPRVDSHIEEKGALSANKWYLAHIHGIFKDNHISKSDGERLFPNVKVIDWKFDKLLNKYCRDLNIDVNDAEYKILIACFLRFIDPINYYIVPNSNCEVNDIYSGKSQKSIGEYPPLSYYIYENNDIYSNKKVIKEFEDYALVNYQKDDYGSKVIDVAYREPNKCVSNKKKSDSKKAGTNHARMPKITSTDKIKIVKLFLTDNSYTYRTLDCLLGYPNDNHGNRSFAIVKDFKDKKGILSKVSIEDEIKNASGIYKEWLLIIKDNYNL